jgi:hypothetical protein
MSAPPQETPKAAAKRRARKPAGESAGVKAHNAAMGSDQPVKKRAALEKTAAQDREGMDALEPGGDVTSLVNNLRGPLDEDDSSVEADSAADDKEGDEDGPSWLERNRERFGEQRALLESRKWLVGCPPELGGIEGKSFEVYTQAPLGWFARTRFFALITAALAKAIKASGGDVGGMADVFGPEGGSLIDRARVLSRRDWNDASSFFALTMELVSYVPNLLSEMYCIILAVPTKDRTWFKEVMEQRWDPDIGDYGLRDEDHREVIARFIDQNYEELRGFFTDDLPMFVARIGAREEERKVRESTSAPSKPSSTSGRQAAATS